MLRRSATRRRAGWTAALAIACALIAAPQASGAQVIGESYGGSGGVACHYGGTQIQTASAGNFYAAPYDGVITSWSNQGYFWPTITFKVARLGSGSSYSMVGSDGPRTVAAFNQKETYPIRMPVRQGDVIGAYIPVDDYTCVYSGGTIGTDDANVPAGGSGFFDTTYGGQVPVEATIEHDVDGDGYGDETQDLCPTSSVAHGPCPLPTTLGQTFTPVPLGGTSAGTTTVVTGSLGVISAAQADGIITSWSFQASADVDGSLKFKALRPLGGNNYLTVGESDPRTPAPNTLNKFPTRIAVRQGDRIGIWAKDIGVSSNASAMANSIGFLSADPAPGTSATFGSSGVVGRRIDVSAVLEADADGDGYGDTSQDRCPTDPSTQGTCPVKPPPSANAACDKAKAKLAKAKAKLKKLKKNDAPAKKVKKAKKKVKNAKDGVEKAC